MINRNSYSVIIVIILIIGIIVIISNNSYFKRIIVTTSVMVKMCGKRCSLTFFSLIFSSLFFTRFWLLLFSFWFFDFFVSGLRHLDFLPDSSTASALSAPSSSFLLFSLLLLLPSLFLFSHHLLLLFLLHLLHLLTFLVTSLLHPSTSSHTILCTSLSLSFFALKTWFPVLKSGFLFWKMICYLFEMGCFSSMDFSQPHTSLSCSLLPSPASKSTFPARSFILTLVLTEGSSPFYFIFLFFYSFLF